MNLRGWSLGIGAWVALSAVSLAQVPTAGACHCKCNCQGNCCQTAQSVPQNAITAESFESKDFVLTKRQGLEWCCHVAVPQLSVDSKLAAVYPGLAQGLDVFNKRGRAEAFMLMNKFMGVLSSTVRTKTNTDVMDWAGESFRYYESAVDAVRLDNKAVSFLELYSIYTGGPHDEYGLLGYTFDPVTGQVITLDDLIVDKNALRQYVSESLQKKYPQASFFDRDETLNKLFNAPADNEFVQKIVEHHWVMTDTGIVFHFNPYEVASFADGLLTVEVDANDCLELFRPKARKLYFKTERNGEQSYKPVCVRPAELNQMVGKWRLISGEIEGDKSSAKELGIDCQIEVNREGLAHLTLKDQNSVSHNREMSVRVVATPLYDGCPQDKWSAYLFDAQGEREFQATVLPDGTMRMMIFTYVKNQEYPQVFTGDFVRE